MSESGDSDVSVGEMFRLFGRTEKAMDEGFKGVNERFDKFETRFVTKELYESERDNLVQRVVDIEDAPDKRGANYKVTIALICSAASAAGTLGYWLSHLH